MEKKEKFLPIGSVVLLSGGEKKVMITGFCSAAVEDQSTVFDYTGCVYPEGFLDFEQICLFNHDQIDKVYFEGYVDDEERTFKQILNEMLETDVADIPRGDDNSFGDVIIPDLVSDDSSDEQMEYL